MTHPARKPGEVAPGDLTQKSLAVVRTHESKQAPGALIASLAIAWGFSQGDKDQGGYHLVWSRDMVETAGGMLAAGAHEDTRRVREKSCASRRWLRQLFVALRMIGKRARTARRLMRA